MSQISRRRADQFRDFVLHLKLAAVDFQNIFLAAVEHFRQRFDGSGLSRSGGTEQEKNSSRPAFGREAGLIHLHVGNYLGQGVRLPDDAIRKMPEQIASFIFPAATSIAARPLTARLLHSRRCT